MTAMKLAGLKPGREHNGARRQQGNESAKNISNESLLGMQ